MISVELKYVKALKEQMWSLKDLMYRKPQFHSYQFEGLYVEFYNRT